MGVDESHVYVNAWLGAVRERVSAPLPSSHDRGRKDSYI